MQPPGHQIHCTGRTTSILSYEVSAGPLNSDLEFYIENQSHYYIICKMKDTFVLSVLFYLCAWIHAEVSSAPLISVC